MTNEALDNLRAAQLGALRESLGSRVEVTRGGSVLVDGVDFTSMLDDVEASLEFDESLDDFVARVRVALGEDPRPARATYGEPGPRDN